MCRGGEGGGAVRMMCRDRGRGGLYRGRGGGCEDV